jgi:hypothetical protein
MPSKFYPMVLWKRGLSSATIFPSVAGALKFFLLNSFTLPNPPSFLLSHYKPSISVSGFIRRFKKNALRLSRSWFVHTTFPLSRPIVDIANQSLSRKTRQIMATKKGKAAKETKSTEMVKNKIIPPHSKLRSACPKSKMLPQHGGSSAALPAVAHRTTAEIIVSEQYSFELARTIMMATVSIFVSTSR